MNEPIRDGGSAFPGFQYTDGRGSHRMGPNGEWEFHAPGLTKRELFAAMAMQSAIGLLGRAEYLDKFRSKSNETGMSIEAVISELSVNQADALLAALNQQPEATLPEHKEVK